MSRFKEVAEHMEMLGKYPPAHVAFTSDLEYINVKGKSTELRLSVMDVSSFPMLDVIANKLSAEDRDIMVELTMNAGHPMPLINGLQSIRDAGTPTDRFVLLVDENACCMLLEVFVDANPEYAHRRIGMGYLISTEAAKAYGSLVGLNCLGVPK